MIHPVGINSRVRVLRGRWNNLTGLVVAATETSVKVRLSECVRWYGRSEVRYEA